MNNGTTPTTPEATSDRLPPLLESIENPSPAFRQPEEITEENGAEQYAKVLHKSIDDATQVIVNSLDQLIKEIEKMKAKVIKTGGAAKAGITSHFSLGNEAAKFTQDIHTKLTQYIEEAESAIGIPT